MLNVYGSDVVVGEDLRGVENTPAKSGSLFALHTQALLYKYRLFSALIHVACAVTCLVALSSCRLCRCNFANVKYWFWNLLLARLPLFSLVFSFLLEMLLLNISPCSVCRVTELKDTMLTVYHKASKEKTQHPYGLCIWSAGNAPRQVVLDLAKGLPEQTNRYVRFHLTIPCFKKNTCYLLTIWPQSYYCIDLSLALCLSTCLFRLSLHGMNYQPISRGVGNPP